LIDVVATTTVLIPEKNDSIEIYQLLGEVKNFTNNSTVRLVEKILVFTPLLTSLLLLLTPVFSGASLNNYLLYIGILILQFFGFKKESKPWGTVYSSLTKKPVPFTRVEIFNQQSRKLESVVSDPNGRYGFLVSEYISTGNAVALMAFQKNYSFPSVKETTSMDNIFYTNIYKGGFVNIPNGVANFDLPMDPTSNKQIQSTLGIASIGLNTTLIYLINTLFITGLVVGIVSLILNPDPVNLSLILAVLFTYFLRRFGFKLKKFGLTIDTYTKQIVPFSFVALHDATGKRVAFTVSDEKGRYFILAERGKYELKAYTNAGILPMRQISMTVNTKSGWISRIIKL
jgi:hypothetical protein